LDVSIIVILTFPEEIDRVLETSIAGTAGIVYTTTSVETVDEFPTVFFDNK
jgi:hypothetical protein